MFSGGKWKTQLVRELQKLLEVMEMSIMFWFSELGGKELGINFFQNRVLFCKFSIVHFTCCTENMNQ